MGNKGFLRRVRGGSLGGQAAGDRTASIIYDNTSYMRPLP